MNYFSDLFRRLCLSWRWIAAQFVGIDLLIGVGLAWTRLPEKHVWQVVLTPLLPLMLLAAALVLQAGTMRRLMDGEPRRFGLAWGASSLLVWVAMAWAAWAVLDWCDGQIPQWAGYLNSRASAHARATLFTCDHVQRWLSLTEWIIRWIAVPGKLIPLSTASALWGWRLPWRRVTRLIWNWRWWLAAVLAALVGVWLPGHFFMGEPYGTVQAQMWRVGLKLAATYLLGVGCWVLLLGWLAVLFGRQHKQPPAKEAPAPVPVLAGPEEKTISAKAEVPHPDEPQQE